MSFSGRSKCGSTLTRSAVSDFAGDCFDVLFVGVMLDEVPTEFFGGVVEGNLAGLVVEDVDDTVATA